MHDDASQKTLPGNVVIDMATAERMVTSAAMTAARETLKEVRDKHPTREEMEDIAEKAVDRFLEKAFDIPPGDTKALIDLRKDFTAMRAAREMREAMIKHGLLAVVGLFIMAIGTAVWMAIKGAR